MLIIPYSTALKLSRPPYVSYAAVAICVIVYALQLGSPITETLLYFPDSWNPLTMVSASFAHGGFWHLFGNLVFFMAFAPAIEILLGNPLRYIGLILFICLASGVSYSIWISLSGADAIPTLGFSGVVMGMIGLSAYLMPQARVRVFCWFLVWKIFFVPAWIMAVIYIGLDAWAILSGSDFGGINLVAHVAGGLAGYVYGLLWLAERRQDTSAELANEIEAMRVEQRYGKTRAEAFRPCAPLANAINFSPNTLAWSTMRISPLRLMAWFFRGRNRFHEPRKGTMSNQLLFYTQAKPVNSVGAPSAGRDVPPCHRHRSLP